MVARDIWLTKENLFVLVFTAGTGLTWQDCSSIMAFTAAGSSCSKS